jgi:hypothetical protein
MHADGSVLSIEKGVEKRVEVDNLDGKEVAARVAQLLGAGSS